MKHIALTLAVAAAAAPLAAIAGAALADQPPLIDRNLFYGEVTIAGAQISPDGRYLSFLKPFKGTRNIWVKGADEPFSAARPVSAEATRPIRSYFWSHDSKFILYVQDSGGDENFNVYAIDPTLPADSKKGVPPTRALTNLKGVRTEIFAVPKAKPDILYIGLNDRDPKWHDLYELSISSGSKKLLRKNTDEIAVWQFDDSGTLRLAVRTTKNGDTETLRVDADGFKTIYSCSVLENCSAFDFDAGGKNVYFATNKGALDLTELEVLDVATGATTKVEGDPDKRVDLYNVEISQLDHRILFTEYEGDMFRRYFKDRPFKTDYDWLQSKLPGLEISFGARSNDENIWIVSAHSDTEPGIVYVWNRKAKTLVQQYRVREEIQRDALARRKPYHYKSSDGLDIPAYLTLPVGLPAKNLPLVVYPHGGPWARDSFGYDTNAQFLANRGYAVLQPNFRASTGFGKKFLNAGNGEWGRKMQDDITWGVKSLVASGVVDPKLGMRGGESNQRLGEYILGAIDELLHATSVPTGFAARRRSPSTRRSR